MAKERRTGSRVLGYAVPAVLGFVLLLWVLGATSPVALVLGAFGMVAVVLLLLTLRGDQD